MVESGASKRRAEEYVNLVSLLFPDIACLRCGNKDFFIMPNIHDLSGMNVVTISCNRCGHIEQHHAGTLREALREGKTPIPLKNFNEQK